MDEQSKKAEEDFLKKLAAPKVQEILKAEKEEYLEENHFPSGRKGAAALKAAKYVEIESNREPVAEMRSGEMKTFGYFCQTCKYMMEKKDAPEGVWCRKWQAEDAPHGCCDVWEAKENDSKS